MFSWQSLKSSFWLKIAWGAFYLPHYAPESTRDYSVYIQLRDRFLVLL
jgi:hypothetical protein